MRRGTRVGSGPSVQAPPTRRYVWRGREPSAPTWFVEAECAGCGQVFSHSGDPRRRFCTTGCRTSAGRAGVPRMDRHPVG